MANDLRLQVVLDAIDKATRPLKQINNGSLETARALKAARDRLKELNTQQKDVSAWRTQRAASEMTSAALTAAREKVKALSQQFAATGAPTRAMTREFQAAVREATNSSSNTSSRAFNCRVCAQSSMTPASALKTW